MAQYAPKFRQEYRAKLPALTLSPILGWLFLSPRQTLAAYDGKANKVVLGQVLRSELKKPTFTFAGSGENIR